MHTHAEALIEHLLFFFLLVVAPAWDFHYTRQLKLGRSPRGKVGVYKTLCTWLWVTTAIACAALGLGPLFLIHPAPGDIPWLDLSWVRYLIEAVLVLFVIGLLLPIGIGVWKNLTKTPRSYRSADALKPLSFILPATMREREWFTFVCITAGICEELLFRGFLLYYLHVFPWKLNLTVALVIASVIFGIQHLYQGIGGVVQTTIMGFLFGLLFLLTGNLLQPILLHLAADLRVLLLLRPANAEAARA